MDRYARTFTVRWSDCDANQHMRNTAYSEYGVDVRMDYFAERGLSFEDMAQRGFGPVLLREEIDYLRELHLGQKVTVDFSLLGLSPDGGRWKVQHELFHADGTKAARMVLTGGFLDLKARKLVLPTPQMLELFIQLPRAEGYAELPNLHRH